MTTWQKISLLLLRLGLGWVFLYAGTSKLTHAGWSAEGYIKSAQTFPSLYALFLQPNVLPIINKLVVFGLIALGLGLILGIFTRLVAGFGILLMLLLYFPIMHFPLVGQNAWLVDEHIMYSLILLTLAAFRAGRVWGLEKWCSQLPICSRYPRLRNWLG